MATIKHPDTFKCDVCGREIERAHSITLPVRWTTEQILEARAKAVAELERRGYEVVDTYFKDGLAVPHKVVNEPLYYLSQSLAEMACCDAVFLCEGWENARGCRVERAAAVAYDLEIIGHDIPCTGGAR